MKKFSFRFDTKEKGLKQVLGDLEYEIMEIVWDLKQVTVRRVHEKLKTKRDLAYTTIMTVMSRLTDKGILERIKQGSPYQYQAVLNKDDFINSSVRSVLGNLLNDFSSPAINQFVELLDEADPEKIEELAQLIEKKRKKKDA
jgi:predicted transcriptional regulator